MKLTEELESLYTREPLRARAAQRAAEFIAWGPVVFQVSRLMVKLGILEALNASREGLTIEEVASRAGISEYAARVLLEASLSIGTVLVDTESERYSCSKTGWFLLNDEATRVNMDFNHDVNYRGMFHMEEALLEGRPAGLKTFGEWPTIYEGLSSLPEQAQRSWFAFDHFYSDHSFDKALEVVFALHPSTILDVGGNTGRWAQRCVEHSSEVAVTVLDLPQQIRLMRAATAGAAGVERIEGIGANLLDPDTQFPQHKHWDVIWMSQFLDCFGEEEILSILQRAAKAMDSDTRLCIMETLWDSQRFEPATMCLTLTSLYFSVMANGNSKMYSFAQLSGIIRQAGLEIESAHHNIGQGHSILVCKLCD